VSARKEMLERLISYRINVWASDGQSSNSESAQEERELEPDLTQAHVVSSVLRPEPGTKKKSPKRHMILLDLDYEAHLIPSTREGHYHLYLDVPDGVPQDKWEAFMTAAKEAGVIQEGYAESALKRGFACLRLPWVKKSKDAVAQEEEDEEATGILTAKKKPKFFGKSKNVPPAEDPWEGLPPPKNYATGGVIPKPKYPGGVLSGGSLMVDGLTYNADMISFHGPGKSQMAAQANSVGSGPHLHMEKPSSAYEKIKSGAKNILNAMPEYTLLQNHEAWGYLDYKKNPMIVSIGPYGHIFTHTTAEWLTKGVAGGGKVLISPAKVQQMLQTGHFVEYMKALTSSDEQTPVKPKSSKKPKKTKDGKPIVEGFSVSHGVLDEINDFTVGQAAGPMFADVESKAEENPVQAKIKKIIDQTMGEVVASNGEKTVDYPVNKKATDADPSATYTLSPATSAVNLFGTWSTLTGGIHTFKKWIDENDLKGAFGGSKQVIADQFPLLGVLKAMQDEAVKSDSESFFNPKSAWQPKAYAGPQFVLNEKPTSSPPGVEIALEVPVETMQKALKFIQMDEDLLMKHQQMVAGQKVQYLHEAGKTPVIQYHSDSTYSDHGYSAAAKAMKFAAYYGAGKKNFY
jgi:hypothetical protein